MSGNNKQIWISDDGAIYNSWEEKNQADARYKQHKQQLNELESLKAEQERANQLAQKKMAEERANAEKIAQATVQAEREKALYQAVLQQQQHDYEEEQRKIRLCDELGADYEEIKIFEDYLNKGDNSLIEKIDSLKNDIEHKEKILEEYRKNKPDENKIVTSFENKIRNLQNEIELKNKVDYRIIKIMAVMYIIISIIIYITTGGDDTSLIVVAIIAVIFMISTIVLIATLKIGAKTQTNKLKAQIKDIENHKKIALDEFNKTKENKLLEYNEKVSNYLKDIDKAKKEYEELENQNKQVLVDKGNKFIEFRLTHYNEEMEMLLNKLKLKSLKIIDMAFEQQNGYIEEYASKKGTVKDYIKYIREAIRNS